MLPLDDILKIAQMGLSGVLLVILLNLWNEFKAQNEFIRQMLLQAEKDRAAIKQAVGADASSTVLQVVRDVKAQRQE